MKNRYTLEKQIHLLSILGLKYLEDHIFIISLYKGKSAPENECKNDEPITALSVLGKVFAHVIHANNLFPPLPTCRPQQSGFMKNRSKLDAILALRFLSKTVMVMSY